jgi:hypothetical protein
MEIIIKGVVVETKEITGIVNYTRDRFYNRYCGFHVHLHKKPSLLFEWDIPYERTPWQIHDAKEQCEALRLEIIKEWEKDKVFYPPEIPLKQFDLGRL